jgi:hypothetical protein
MAAVLASTTMQIKMIILTVVAGLLESVSSSFLAHFPHEENPPLAGVYPSVNTTPPVLKISTGFFSFKFCALGKERYAKSEHTGMFYKCRFVCSLSVNTTRNDMLSEINIWVIYQWISTGFDVLTPA